MPAPVTRIFSDLHYRDGHSSLQRLESLTPLLTGADRIILNGDTLDTQSAGGLPDADEVRAFFPQHAPNITFLTGNHDPFFAPKTEMSVLHERVWITHGDVLFEGIAPWSGHREELLRRLARLSADVAPEEVDLIETRLRLNRLACLDLPDPHDRFARSPLTRAMRLAHILIPPTRPLAMLRAWRDTPALARRLARSQRAQARLVVIGHTHFPGVWRDAQGPVIVNTGSFCRPFGGLFVELRGDDVEVIRIVHKNGEFRRGRVIAGFSLAP